MRNLLWIIVAIVIIGGGFWWWNMSGNTSLSNTNTAVNENAASNALVATTTANTSVTTPVATPPAQPTTVTIAYDGKVFSPKTVTVKVGDTVMFQNSTKKNMWIASDEHPTHTEFDGTSRTTHCAANYTGATPFDQCKPATTDYSFTFTKAGAFSFHDHLNASASGTVTVQ